MATEIEHKYLIKPELWKKVVPYTRVDIRQGYLLTDPSKTVRIRTKGNTGYLTIKGKTQGASRVEFEYEIPFADAMELLTHFCSQLIEKTRHLVLHEGKTWEVDEFKGLNAGLIVAEIELKSEEETYVLPDWVDKNVTEDLRYANSNLSVNPFSKW